MHVHLYCRCVHINMYVSVSSRQMRTSARWGTPVLTPATTSWVPTTARVREASPSQLTAGRVKVRPPACKPPSTAAEAGAVKVKCPLLLLLLDIDECSLDGSVCHDGQDCMNTIGSYRCVMRCGRGFRRTADGLSCAGTSSGFVCPSRLKQLV